MLISKRMQRYGKKMKYVQLFSEKFSDSAKKH
jgi:hypothetical protein